MASCSLKAKIISEVTTRRSGASTDAQQVFWGITPESKIVRFAAEFNALNNVKIGNYVYLTGVKTTPRPDMLLCYVLDHTEIFRTSEFAFDQSVVDDFDCAKLVSIAEAIGSPAKKRISVEGRIVKIYPKRQTEQWVRSEFDICDEKQNLQIKLKMWNDHANPPFKEGMNVKVTNVTTDVYNNTVSLNSTAKTTYEIKTAISKELTITVEGYNMEGTYIVLITNNGAKLVMKPELLKSDLMKMKFPKTLDVVVNDNEITRIVKDIEQNEQGATGSDSTAAAADLTGGDSAGTAVDNVDMPDTLEHVPDATDGDDM